MGAQAVVVRGWGGRGLCPTPNPTLPLALDTERQTQCQIRGELGVPKGSQEEMPGARSCPGDAKSHPSSSAFPPLVGAQTFPTGSRLQAQR